VGHTHFVAYCSVGEAQQTSVKWLASKKQSANWVRELADCSPRRRYSGDVSDLNMGAAADSAARTLNGVGSIRFGGAPAGGGDDNLLDTKVYEP